MRLLDKKSFFILSGFVRYPEKPKSQRYEWIKNHLIFDDDYMDEYQHTFNNTTLMINAIPKNTTIIIWVGENSHEQTGLRYVLYLLKDKNHDIFLMDPTNQYKRQFDILDSDCYPLHTGEIISEKLRLIYEKSRKIPPSKSRAT